MQISILQLTEQYLVFIAEVRERNLELAADYLVMAATLVQIKSRMLIPQSEEEEEEQDSRSELIRRLQEYQRYKSASESISNIPRLDRDFLFCHSLIKFS